MSEKSKILINPRQLINESIEIFLQEKRQFVEAKKAFNRFNKSCTDFEETICCSSTSFTANLKNGFSRVSVHKIKSRKINFKMEEKKNDIRPPLVGQASTSSNESSIDLHENNSSEDDETKKLGLYNYEPRPRYDGAQPSSESSDKNSNDEIQIITQAPQLALDRNFPVGCSNVTSADTSLELPDGRIPTPSSVSSLNSKRGLEWDNLGDVGYSNANLTSDSLAGSGLERDSYTMGANTLERIVSMDTERRFDPDGTTESTLPSLPRTLPLTPAQNTNNNSPSLSTLNSTKPLLFQLGKPNAESTPNSNEAGGGKPYGSSGKDYGTSNKDYVTSSKDYKVGQKYFKSPNKDHGTKKDCNPANEFIGGKDHGSSFSQYASQGRETFFDQGDKSSEEYERLPDRLPEGFLGSSSDNDPITEYEIKQESSAKADEKSGGKNSRSEGKKRPDKSKEGFVERFVKDHFERTDDEKHELRRKEKRHGESGRRETDREHAEKDTQRGKERREKGYEEVKEKEIGDFDEVLVKYGRGKTRREDIDGSAEKNSLAQSNLGQASSSQDHRSHGFKKNYSKNHGVSSHSSNRQQRNQESLGQDSEYFDADDHVTQSINYRSVSIDVQKKAPNTNRVSSSTDKAHKETRHSERSRRVIDGPKDISEQEAVDKCRKNNDHIKEIVEKYNESLKEHRAQIRRTDKSKDEYQQMKEKYLRHQQHQNFQHHQNEHQQSTSSQNQKQNLDQNLRKVSTSSQSQKVNLGDSSTTNKSQGTRNVTQTENTTKTGRVVPDSNFPLQLGTLQPSTYGGDHSNDLSPQNEPIADANLKSAHGTKPTLKSVYRNEEKNSKKYTRETTKGDLEHREKESSDPLERTKRYRRKYYRLFPHSTEDGSGVRRTNSLEHVLSEQGLKSSTLPRYHSVASLILDEQQAGECYRREFVEEASVSQLVDPTGPVPYSASSSSLSTIITKRTDQDVSPQKLSKLIQASAGQSSVTTQTVPCREGGRLCTGAHPRRPSRPPDNPSDLEDDHILIRESNPDSKTNCNTLDSVGSVETVGSWVGKTYYNNRKPDGENLEDDPGNDPPRKSKPKLLTQDSSPDVNASYSITSNRSPDGNDPYSAEASYNEANVNGPYENGEAYSERNVEGVSGTYDEGLYYGEQDRSNGEVVYERDSRQDNEGNGEVDITDNRIQTVERSLQIDRVNSFEYLPGPVYEQNQATHDSSSDDHEDEDDHPGDPEVNELHPEVNDLSLSPSHSGSSSSLSSTLQGDVITGVHFIQDLVANSNNSRKFIKHFVQTLIQSSPDAIDVVKLPYRAKNINGACGAKSEPYDRNTRGGKQNIKAQKQKFTNAGDTKRDEMDGHIELNGEHHPDQIPRITERSKHLRGGGDFADNYSRNNQHLRENKDPSNEEYQPSNRRNEQIENRIEMENRRKSESYRGDVQNNRFRKVIDQNNRCEKNIESDRYRNEMLHQNVPFTPVRDDTREENISGESATKSSTALSLSGEKDMGEQAEREDHTTSSEFFKPSPKVFNLQPSILYAPAHSTTLTSEDDSHLCHIGQSHKNRARPLSPPSHQRTAMGQSHKNRPRPLSPSSNQRERSQPSRHQFASQPLGSRSEEEVISKQELAMRRLYEKQQQVRGRVTNGSQNIGPSVSRAVNGEVPIKSILTNRKRAPIGGAESSPTLSSSHPSPPPPAPVCGTYNVNERRGKDAREKRGGACDPNSGDDWRSPVTESEKLYDMQKRAGVVRSSNGADSGANETLVGYLQLERQNQLDWIKAEIDHLTSLKSLLEKQETLKRSISAYKQSHRARKALSSAQPHAASLSGSSEPGSNPRPSVQEIAGEPLPHGVPTGDKEKVDLKVSDEDGASIYAHKLDKDSKSKEERGKFLLPCEYRRRRAAVPTTLKLKHNINEMMTRSVKTSLLEKNAKSSTTAATRSTLATVPSSDSKNIESTGIQTSDSILNLPHWLQQPDSVQPSNSKKLVTSSNQLESDKESVCPCLADLYKRLGQRGKELTAGQRGKMCKCYGGRVKEKAPPPPVGYVITFEPLPKKLKKPTSSPLDAVPKSTSASDTEPSAKCRTKTLQEYLEENRPDYVNKAEVRRQCLAEKSYLREQQDTVQHKQKVLLTALKNGSESDQSQPRGTNVRRIFTTRELRAMTRRKYEHLPEVQMKKIDAKRKEDYRTNKLMAEVFTKKLQRKTLKGVVDLSNSDQVLTRVS